MSDDAPVDPSLYEWQPCSLLFPRIAKLMTRDGIHTRLIIPGYYFVRRSRTYGWWIYRHHHDDDDD
ncbi:hypothetical protein CVO77_17690 [Sphingopyxis lindanitolerans]|uniref:Uncharacterized protein n=1 Tax=Sphingopyxis lindanitolerans TaxID=2054227 RepID=A0A2S8B3B2_9SPHN|nr:hypothetical protein [Sphingopyxis lindanitolerans]PQM26816.1 hypothetical protein CVO77_17690 [Sphingopyxis lindanitolerans]